MAAELPPEVREQLLSVFSMLDRNGSGDIELKEIGFLMNKLLGQKKDDDQLMEILSEIADSDVPGASINFDMFCKALGPVMMGSTEDELDQMAFQALDADKSGCINAAELGPIMAHVAGSKLTQQQVGMVLDLTSGQDGKLRYEDFKRAIRPQAGAASSSSAAAPPPAEPQPAASEPVPHDGPG